MNKWMKLLPLVLLILAVVSCGEVPTVPAEPGAATPAAPTAAPATPGSAGPQGDWPAAAQPLVELVYADLLSRAKVSTAAVVSVEEVQWRDGCLECAQEGERCTQVILSGYRIVLESEGQQYEYRTDSGTAFRLCANPWGAAQPLVDLVLADQAARNPGAAVTVVSVEAVQWPDGCLGCAKEGELCTEAIVAGYRIRLQSGDQQVEYRTDSGTGFRLCESAWGAAQPLVDQALADLTARNPGAAATVVSVEAVEWRNGCLECAGEGEMCTEAIVPGYRVILESENQQYEYRTDSSSTIRRCPADAVLSPEAQALLDKARAGLAARLQIGEDEIRVVTVEQVQWRDGSIGCAKPGQAYITVIVPGYRIVLEAAGKNYYYHAGNRGEGFWCEQPTQ